MNFKDTYSFIYLEGVSNTLIARTDCLLIIIYPDLKMWPWDDQWYSIFRYSWS